MKQTSSNNSNHADHGDRGVVQERDRTTEMNAATTAIVTDTPEITEETTETETGDTVRDTPAAPPSGSSRALRRGLLAVIGVLVLSVGGAFGWRWWQFNRTHVSTDNAQIEGHTSPISAQVTANVQQVLVKQGDVVEAGQPLVILGDPDIQLKIQQAEAQLAVATAQLQSATDTIPLTQQTNTTQVQQAQAKLLASQSAINAAQATVTQAQAAIATNQAAVAQAQAEVDQAQADFRRYQALYQEGAISAQRFDAARTAVATAEAQLAAANRTVAQSQAELNNAQAQLQRTQSESAAAQGQVAETQVAGQNVTIQRDQRQLAQAQVEQAQAQLDLARQQAAYTTIKSPLSGTIGDVTAQVGQRVQSGQPLMTLVPLQTDQVYVEANFKETSLARLQIGETADVEVDAYPGETFEAVIAGISPATGSNFALLPPDNATGNFNKVVQWVPVRLVFDADADPQHKLRPGLSVNVTVDTTSTAQ